MQTSFASDNFCAVHPDVMAALEKANSGHTMAYGDDPWTKRAKELFKHHFGPEAEAFPVFNGTGANVCAIKHALKSWQAVLCSQTSHIWTDECGAVQAISGCNLLPHPAINGKLDPAALASYLYFEGSPHHVQPAALSITQSTELGTVYSLEELKKLARFAKEHKLLFLMDGARICNAAAALNLPLKALTTDIGVDILSFGGTKNGLMGAEAVVFLKEGLAEHFEFVRKQTLQLGSKMRYLSAQIAALLENDLWLQNAGHANAMAKLLEEKLKKQFPELPILYPVEANSLFVQLPPEALLKLQKKSFFWIWDETNAVARWMTGWDTKPEWIDAHLKHLEDSL